MCITHTQYQSSTNARWKQLGKVVSNCTYGYEGPFSVVRCGYSVGQLREQES